MKILNNTPVLSNQFIGLNKKTQLQSIPAYESKNINLNHINPANIALVKFRGRDKVSFEQTLKDNYFNLPINKETNEPYEGDVYQTASAENLYHGNDVVVEAPTGTGKTAIAHYIIQKNLKEGKKTFYTAPLKALSNDKVREFRKIYGDDNVGLLTGDRKINTKAPIIIMTTEVYRNMMMQDRMSHHNPVLKGLKTVVFDELHYLHDEDRGGVWEQSIMLSRPKTQILGLSGTMENAGEITDWIASTRGREKSHKAIPDEYYHAPKLSEPTTVLIKVPSENRHVPLDFHVMKFKPQTGEKKMKMSAAKHLDNNPLTSLPTDKDYMTMVDKLQKEDKLPAIFFLFSKKKSKQLLNEMQEKPLTTLAERNEISSVIKDFKSNGKYLGELLDEEALKSGYTIHNAGMLPDQKELVEKLFQKKLLKVAIATETLSAGINMPARTTVITSLMKPVSKRVNEDGVRRLSPNEFHQMAGRAGRRGIDERGYTYCMAVNPTQEKAFAEIIKEKSNKIESHLKTDFAFVANVAKNGNSEEFLDSFYENSLFAYDKEPKNRKVKAKPLLREFRVKDNILKNEGFLAGGRVTEKGELLSQLNGYEQIPVVDAIYNKDFKEMNPQQLAGYVAGLATMSTEESNKELDFNIEIEDDLLAERTKEFAERIDDYNDDVYSKLNQKLFFNTDSTKHVYTWANMNSQDDDSTNNWKEMFKGDIGFKLKDEGSLFKEIAMTTDLLKQISSIADKENQSSLRGSDKRYYANLKFTAEEAIELINKSPAKQDE